VRAAGEAGHSCVQSLTIWSTLTTAMPSPSSVRVMSASSILAAQGGKPGGELDQARVVRIFRSVETATSAPRSKDSTIDAAASSGSSLSWISSTAAVS